MKSLHITKKVILATIFTFVLTFSSAFAQIDTMYIIKQGYVLGKYIISDVDSVIFYTPTTSNVNIVINPITGKMWMDRNLGALWVATSSTDTGAYGDLYQWGRETDGHEKRKSALTTNLSSTDTTGHGNLISTNSVPHDWRSPQNDTLWKGVNGINNPCPSGFRLPTDAEWEAERASWSSNNAAGAIASPLKLPAAGFRDSFNGALLQVGSHGNYWSSTSDETRAWLLNFTSTAAEKSSGARKYARSVRCIKD